MRAPTLVPMGLLLDARNDVHLLTTENGVGIFMSELKTR